MEDVQKEKNIQIPNSIEVCVPSSSKVQKKRKNRKRVSEVKSKSTEYRKYREKANVRNRKYLAKLNEAQREERNWKKREAYQKKKDLNLIKGINDLKPREQINKRKYWRKASEKCRKRKKQLENVDTSQMNSEPEPHVALSHTPLSSQRVRGQKVRAQNRARMLREIQKRNRSIAILQRKGKTLQKSLRRKQSSSKNSAASPSPNKKVEILTRGYTVPKTVRKQLLYGISLHSQLKSTAETLPARSCVRQIFNKCISGSTLKKYKVQHLAQDILTPKQNKKFAQNLNVAQYERKSKVTVNVQAIRSYFERDDISRMSPGKKDFIVRGKNRKQKRILLGNIKRLHRRFIKENGNISYSTFWKYKPFWVVFPRLSDRNTCLCVKHENMKFLTKKLNSVGIINFAVPEILVGSLTCNNENADCMLGKCKECKDNVIAYEADEHNEDIISHFKWVTETVEKSIKGSMRKIKITKKVSLDKKPSEIIENVNREIPSFKKHIFSAYHQITTLQSKRKILKCNEIILQIDFSENYVTKIFDEVHSMHFGASKRQISIHTGVAYYLEKDSVSCLPFATVSNNLDHGAIVVWAHLDPILKKLINEIPDIDTIHFFSDGPTSQYRNRSNIFFMITHNTVFLSDINFFSWNYSESGHGKGPMDGVGGFLKRSADAFVMHGNDISSAEDFVKVFQESKVEVLLIKEEEIEAMRSFLPSKLPAIRNIMKIHQITYSKEQRPRIFLRSPSCFACCLDSPCNRFPSDKPTFDFNVVPVEPTLLLLQSVSSNSHKIPNVGTWVRVEYLGKRRKHQFIVKITSVEIDDMYEVKFLKKSKIGEFYIFPENDDTDFIDQRQILEILNEPTFNKRGHYVFNK